MGIHVQFIAGKRFLKPALNLYRKLATDAVKVISVADRLASVWCYTIYVINCFLGNRQRGNGGVARSERDTICACKEQRRLRTKIPDPHQDPSRKDGRLDLERMGFIVDSDHAQFVFARADADSERHVVLICWLKERVSCSSSNVFCCFSFTGSKVHGTQLIVNMTGAGALTLPDVIGEFGSPHRTAWLSIYNSSAFLS